LRAAIRAHTQAIEAELAIWLGRRRGDRSVSNFADELRGLGVRALVEPDMAMPNVRVMAARHGLELPQ
jgi:hypothetical protein